MGLFGPSQAEYDVLRDRVRRLEATVAALATRLEIGPEELERAADRAVTASVSPEVRQLKERGRTIEAIKLVREQTGYGLREAKDLVDRL